jgi:hypothetical protein
VPVSITQGNIDIAIRVVGPNFTDVEVLDIFNGVSSPELLGRNEAAGRNNTAWGNHAALLQAGTLKNDCAVTDNNIILDVAGV